MGLTDGLVRMSIGLDEIPEDTFERMQKCLTDAWVDEPSAITAAY